MPPILHLLIYQQPPKGLNPVFSRALLTCQPHLSTKKISSLSCLDTVTLWACLPSLCLSLKWRHYSLLPWVLFHTIPLPPTLVSPKAASPARVLSWLPGSGSGLPTGTTIQMSLRGLKPTTSTSASWLPRLSEAPDHPPRHQRADILDSHQQHFPTNFGPLVLPIPVDCLCSGPHHCTLPTGIPASSLDPWFELGVQAVGKDGW